ncbi:unnamed protein product [Allacma fusca]|uniref:Uncharacterized protein n=1 Tax=Allacma fusca TaxID=39272 RepID=A0A8J2JG25_9HEXA|nr:unnamed protein product [Allacma fusca]
MRKQLKELHDDLQKIKLTLFLNQNRDTLDTRILKCAAELSHASETGAMKYWRDLQIYLATFDQAKHIASKVIQKVDLEPKENVLPLINFVQNMHVPQAYSSLVKKMKDSNHFYETSETALLAENIKNICGTEQTVFKTLPPALRHITANIVTLRNQWNNGYLYYQSEPHNFFTWFSPHKHRNHYDGLPASRKPRGHWEFNLVDDKVQIINALNGDILMDSKTLFLVELVNDEEIQLKVHTSRNSKIIGKYLVGKARNRGEQFTQIAFFNKNETTVDQLKWSAQAVEPRPMPDLVQKC